VVNATGVFVDDIRRMENPQAKAMLSPSQGVHVIVDKKFLPGDAAIMIPKTEDGRVLFAVPWHEHVVIGTTDTAVPNVDLEPRALGKRLTSFCAPLRNTSIRRRNAKMYRVFLPDCVHWSKRRKVVKPKPCRAIMSFASAKAA